MKTEERRAEENHCGHSAVADMSTDRLHAELVGLVRRMATDTYEMLILIGEWDVRSRWAAAGALSCAAWLAALCDIDVSTVRTQVRVAHALRRFPALDSAMARGDISYAKARVLVAHLTADNVDELLDIAEHHPAGRLGAAIAAWSRRNEDPETIDERHRDMRGVSWRCEPDGMVTFTVRALPEHAADMCALIDTAVMTNKNTTSEHVDDAPAGASGDHPAPQRATLTQQRYDALVRLFKEGGGSVTTEVVIHIRGDGSTLDDGTPISDHAVAGLLDTAFIRLLLHEMDRTPIDASPRRRAPTVRQKRVLDERSPECAHPCCHARAFLQYDHRHPYAFGGTTTLDNLQPLCGVHNRAKDANATGTPPGTTGRAA